MSRALIREIEEELATFPPDEQRRLGADVVSYLQRLREIRRELDKAERSVAAGRVSTLADLDQVIGELRRQHDGA
jgi:hypothetical protein